MRLRSLHACLLAALALAGCKSDRPATVAAAAVTRGPLSEVVSATGEVSALVTVNVGSQISGTVSRLLVDFNTVVKKGELLAGLDPRLFDAALARARAGLASARADEKRARVMLADARRVEERTAKLAAKGLVALMEADTATAARESAEAALDAAAARVGQAHAEADAAATNVALCEIRSPIDGVVISRAVDLGQTVAASLQSPTLFLIANDLARMQILAAVDEADVGKVNAGMRARFTVDAYPGEVFEGVIREVRQAPTTIQNVVTYAAVIDAENPERKLRQGMTASVTIVTQVRASALRLPNAALRYRPASDRAEPEGSRLAGVARAALGRAEAAEPSGTRAPAVNSRGTRQAEVYKLEPEGLVRTSVVLGLSDGHQSEVLSGLSEGDRVAIADAARATAPGGKRGPF